MDDNACGVDNIYNVTPLTSTMEICITYLPLSLLVQLLFMPYIQEYPRYLLTNRCNVRVATKASDKISLINGEGRFNYLIVSESSKNADLR